MVEGVGDTFHFHKCRSRNLVPHRHPIECYFNLKGEASQLPQVHVQYRITAECGNTPYGGKGYYHDQLCDAIARELVCNIDKTSSEASTPTCGGDTFGMELAKSRRFGSSGLNLASKGLLLGASLRIVTEGTHSDPRQSGFLIPNTLNNAEGILNIFCRKPKVPGASMRRLRWVDGAEAH
jgi:hypothetical protein